MMGPRIAALRRQLRMSQAELARRLNISPSAVGMYEQGRREPSAELLVALAGVFGVTTDYLLTGQAGTIPDFRLSQMLQTCLDETDQRFKNRKDRPFSRQELAVLFAAMLTES